MSTPKGNRVAFWWVVVLLTIVGITVAVYHYRRNEVNKSSSYSSPDEPLFVKEGMLCFLNSKRADTISHISHIIIEIADNDFDRAQGLMYRRSMPDSIGMLFVFNEEKQQGFWMRNTYFSLDIIYVNSTLEIVSIQKYTQPFSEVSLPSKIPAMYVVEVNAGYCDNNGIEVGDRIAFFAQNNELIGNNHLH